MTFAPSWTQTDVGTIAVPQRLHHWVKRDRLISLHKEEETDWGRPGGRGDSGR